MGSETPGKSFQPGNVNTIPVKNYSSAAGIASGDDSMVVSVNNFINGKNDNGILIFPVTKHTISTGNYVMYDRGHLPLYAFSMNHDSLESDMNKISDNELKDFMKNAGAENYKKVENTNEAISDVDKKTNGISLWKYMMLAAILMVAGEIFLSKSIDRG